MDGGFTQLAFDVVGLDPGVLLAFNQGLLCLGQELVFVKLAILAD